MDIPAAMHRIEPVLNQVVPALTAEPGANLGQPQIIVGIAEGKCLDRLPAANDDENCIGKPQAQDDPAPMAEEGLDDFLLYG